MRGSFTATGEDTGMSVDTTGGHPAMDYHEHNRTYAGFVRGTIVLSALVALILIGMAACLL